MGVDLDPGLEGAEHPLRHNPLVLWLNDASLDLDDMYMSGGSFARDQQRRDPEGK